MKKIPGDINRGNVLLTAARPKKLCQANGSVPVAGHRQRNPSIVHKRTDTQGGPAADFLRGTLLSVPPQPDGTDSAGYHIAGKPKCNESRPFLAG